MPAAPNLIRKTRTLVVATAIAVTCGASFAQAKAMALQPASSPNSVPPQSDMAHKGCWVLPLEERHKLSPECQKLLGEADVEQARFKECLRLLNTAGIQQGKCDSKSRRYVLDLHGSKPRVLAISAEDDQVLYQVLLSPASK